MSSSIIDPVAIPVTIVGGYLGAGKTTLVNRLLTANHGKRITVVVNDFGEINIDAALIASHDGNTISLTNGCVCCTVAGDLASTLREVSRVRPSPDHIVVEASGVADPVRVSYAARGWSSMWVYRIVTLYDPLTVCERSIDKFVGATVRRQLAGAHLLWPTRLDIVSAEKLAAVARWMQDIAPGVPVADSSEVTDLLVEQSNARTSATDPTGLRSPAMSPPAFTSVTWRPAGQIDRAQLVRAIDRFAGQLERCKGWVVFTDAPDHATLVQHHSSGTELTEQAGLAVDDAALVFIYPVGTIDVAELIDTFDATRVTAVD